MKKKIIYGFGIILLGAFIFGALYLNSLMPIITGYAAKNLASAVFISGRSQAEVEALDLNFSFIQYTKNKVDMESKTVSSRFLWGTSKAIYREGFGCTLLRDVDEKEFGNKKFPKMPALNYAQDSTLWPLGDVIQDTAIGINLPEIEQIAINLVGKQAYGGYAFSFLVMYKGIPVVEKYNLGINKKTRLLSWSMAKSFTSALTGIMVMDGKWDINVPVEINEWQEDDRKNITINNLLQMQSGLNWNEDYGNRSDVTIMLHDKADFARYAYEQPLRYAPGMRWYYSSGTTNIVNYLMRRDIGNDPEYYQFATNRLFNEIGMPHAVFEVDASGTQVGSSYIYATTRDYARFALLYLNDGVFNGERILPEGWVEYSVAEATDSQGKYGSGFWLNLDASLPSAPANMYRCQGHDGQRIFILPDEELAIVVLGYSPRKTNDMDFDRLIGDVLNTLDE